MKLNNLKQMVQQNVDQANEAVAEIVNDDQRFEAWKVVFATLTGMEMQLAVQAHLQQQAEMAAGIVMPAGSPNGHRGPFKV